jgi:FAD/FMN-containing dehydrogenase/Fe-S oxidoreductase
MAASPENHHFQLLQRVFTGELYFDESPEHGAQRRVYATDASVYQELPRAVAIPRTVQDLRWLIQFAREHRTTLIPRAAGTSLAGQVVGSGIVVDAAKYFTGILEVNAEERWVRVQPGVIRDDLNKYLKPHGLLFGPETSTASRAMIGGMVGNNSCGLHSIVWGATRDHLLEAKVLLADGSEAEFKPLRTWRYEAKLDDSQATRAAETRIYRELHALLADERNQTVIRENFPKPGLKRRNTGYALDALLDTAPFTPSGPDFNLCQLLAGSEGTLAFVTEVKLNLLPLPPTEVGVICVHGRSLQEVLRANQVALRHGPWASELVDKYILDFTKENPELRKNRFFIEGDPAAILMVEFFADTPEALTEKTTALIQDLQAAGLGYAYPVVTGERTYPVWDVRKAGLGLIRNLPGDTQPVNLIEDCAVDPEDLPDYIAEVQAMLQRRGLHASYYAHAGAGELHVEPMVNLKTSEGRRQFREVLAETTELVKKYGGSLSGEHGDGRLRGEFIAQRMGPEAYELFRQVKRIFDPNGLFNAGKIVDTPPMDEALRYQPDQPAPEFNTYFDFSRQENILRLTEKCSGSGDCRKTQLTGGTMCPSYMATRSEKDTTRARANALRQFLTDSPDWRAAKGTQAEEVKHVLDLCLSCKGCQTECPSSVDVSKLKAEFLQHYYDAHGVPFRARMIANFTRASRLASLAPWAYNGLMQNGLTGTLAKKLMGFAPQRSLPKQAPQTLRGWARNQKWTVGSGSRQKSVQGELPTATAHCRLFLFADEFTNYTDVELGKTVVKLLDALGYPVTIPDHLESGRTYLSKGLVKDAKRIATENVRRLSTQLGPDDVLVGIEPSAILSFRDEYPDLVPVDLRPTAERLAKQALLIDEFLAREIDAGRITKDRFTQEKRLVKLHGHCHQKALSSLVPTKKLLSLPENYAVQLIPSGCCGMAGSFGYEAEHYEVSMQIGELVLFPTVREQPAEVLIAAPGTSCRHQIKDGTGRTALHPAEILWGGLNGK